MVATQHSGDLEVGAGAGYWPVREYVSDIRKLVVRAGEAQAAYGREGNRSTAREQQRGDW